MKMEWVIAFLIIATVFALATLAYVVVDIVLDLFRKDEEEEEAPAPVVVPVVAPVEEEKPVVVPVVVPVVLPEIVEEIDAEAADEMIDDSLALAVAHHEYGAGVGARSYINLGVIDKYFEAGDTVTLPILKEKRLIPSKIKRIKILADGTLTKPLTIKAESYSIQAMKMIELTGGTVIILEPDPNEKVETKKKSR